MSARLCATCFHRRTTGDAMWCGDVRSENPNTRTPDPLPVGYGCSFYETPEERAAKRPPANGRLKVYGWQGHRSECRAARNGSRATREIIAARSMAEAARLTGHKTTAQMFCLSETRNQTELTVALRMPGVNFWHPLDERPARFRVSKGSR